METKKETDSGRPAASHGVWIFDHSQSFRHSAKRSSLCNSIGQSFWPRDNPRFEWLVNRGSQNGTRIYDVFDLIKLGNLDLRGEPLR
jgi:hypothetical protein